MAEKKHTLSYQFISGPLQKPENNRQEIILRKLVEMAENGTLRPSISKVYSWQELASAHEELETGHTTGKIIIRVSD